jgi:hypothetical protein
MESSLKNWVDSLGVAASRLRHLQTHDALLILSYSLSLPSRHYYTSRHYSVVRAALTIRLLLTSTLSYETVYHLI